MNKDRQLRIGLALNRVAMKLDDESFEKVKADLKEIETLILEEINESEEGE